MDRRKFLVSGATAFAGLGVRQEILAAEPRFQPVPLRLSSDAVSPGTGIVLWDTHEKVETDAIQLEYSYMKYDDVITGRDNYDWTAVDKKLDSIAGRRHQAILRFYDTYPGQKTTVPAYIRNLPDYRETRAKSEGRPTSFPDWSHGEWRRCLLAFFARFSERYDRDPRLAFLQVGFGLWSEYHIYDGPFKLGKTFPSMEFQQEFLRHLADVVRTSPWMISVDAASDEVSPITRHADLLSLNFGVFDDSFLCKVHRKENEPNWNALDRERWKRAPAGGEFSYYTPRDQKEALATNGPYGESFEKAAARFHICFLIGSDQPSYRSMDRIREAGRACGYRFEVTRFETDGHQTRVTVKNTGVAPCYFDMYVSLDGQRSQTSLRHLLPGDDRVSVIDRPPGGKPPQIEADRLVAGQKIPLQANLNA